MAQDEFKHVFGMEMVELPMRAKTKLTARRNAQQTEKTATSSNSYILTSILPPQFMEPEIIQPRLTSEREYLGLVSFITSLIYLNNRVLPHIKLERYMRALNADEYTPIGTLDKVLQQMTKHGYIIRAKDNTGEETQFEYHLGPRAKVEIGEEGVKALIATVYGDEEIEDLDAKFKRNIGVEIKANYDEGDDEGEEAGARKKPAAKRTRRRADADDDE